MVVYNVYEPPYAQGPAFERAERIVFVRDGFHWLAAIFPALWLLVKGLWLELVVFVLAIGVLTWGLEALGTAQPIVGTLLLIVQIVIGYEASAIHGAALERRGWRMAGTMVGRDQAECERHFFEIWLPAQAGAPAIAQTAPAPTWLDGARQRALEAVAQARRLAGVRA